jgi:hypothetical protein
MPQDYCHHPGPTELADQTQSSSVLLLPQYGPSGFEFNMLQAPALGAA